MSSRGQACLKEKKKKKNIKVSHNPELEQRESSYVIMQKSSFQCITSYKRAQFEFTDFYSEILKSRRPLQEE